MVLLWAAALSFAQQAPTLTATPNRPTVTNTAETTQFGVAEVEFGVSAASQQQSLQGLLKFGLLRNVELDWAGDPWLYDNVAHYSGVSDNSPGIRWRFVRQSNKRPTLTVQYFATLPSAGTIEGSGEVDHTLMLLASKDLPQQFHLDVNFGRQWLGSSSHGFDHDWLESFTLSRPVKGKWGAAMEFSGATSPNASTPGIVQNLWAVSYTLKSRLVLDSAVQFRVHGNVPRVVYLGGFTYSIADLYHHKH
jgi:hypothetical protein